MSNVARGRRPSNDNFWRKTDVDALMRARKEIPRLSKSKHIDPLISTMKARVHERKRKMHNTGGSFEDKRKPGGYRHWFHQYGKHKSRRAKSIGDLPKASASRLTLVLSPVPESDDYGRRPGLNLNLPSFGVDFSGSNLMSSTVANSSPSTHSFPERTAANPQSTENTTPADDVRVQFACSIQRQDAKRALADFIDALTDDEILRIAALTPSRSAPPIPTLDPRLSATFTRLEPVPEVVVTKIRSAGMAGLLPGPTALDKDALQHALLRPLNALVDSGRLLQMAEEAEKVEKRAASWARETQLLASARLMEMSADADADARSRSFESDVGGGGSSGRGSGERELRTASADASLRSLAGIKGPHPPVPVRRRPPLVLRSSDGAQDVQAPAPLRVLKNAGPTANGSGIFLQYEAAPSANQDLFYDAPEPESGSRKRFGLPVGILGHGRGTNAGHEHGDAAEVEVVQVELACQGDRRDSGVDVEPGERKVTWDAIPSHSGEARAEMETEHGLRKLLKRVVSVPQHMRPHGQKEMQGGAVEVAVQSPARAVEVHVVGSWETDTPSIYSQDM